MSEDYIVSADGKIHDRKRLQELQALPLWRKIQITQTRIIEWYHHYNGQVYVSFSGGKDSTVLLDLTRRIFPDVEAVFVNTGLEYPEIQKFVKTFDNVTILRPKMRFDEVIKKYGYPLISKEMALNLHYARHNKSEWAFKRLDGENTDGKETEYKRRYKKYKPLLDTDFNTSHYCCLVMKKSPSKRYESKTGKCPIVATMACESSLRERVWIREGCNAFDGKRPISKPISFWTEQDVLQYIKKFNIPIASVYGDVVYADNPEQIRIDDYGIDCGTEKLKTTGCGRTGCIFCAFGCHLEKEPTRFQRLKETHPRQYEYCLGGGEYDENGVWEPNKDGLGMRHVFDELNKIYGKGFIKYE